ncbi:glycosyltransferase family 4 protein [Photobacterium sp. MCCC 1A19761]|uniref:glycosyltransferase family 4 protein n=1 Tax=Photobacterium sp. MCCC 1A19761 TaxID=3115000 RepID=UPI00307FBD34
MINKNLVFVINVDWYFCLHWIERATYFKELGFNVHVISNFTNESIKSQLIQSGFTCHQFGLKRKSVNPFHEISSFIELKRLISSLQPDLIHCVTVKPNIYTGLINRFFVKKPIIYSITGLGLIFSSSSVKFKVLKLIICFLYRLVSMGNARFIFENSDDFKLFLCEGIVKNGNGLVIKGAGIDLNRFQPSVAPGNNTVLFAARLLRDKGLHELVEAKRRLSNRGINFTLKVAGIIDTDVSSAIPMEQINTWSESGDIIWLGNVSDMPSLIKSCDIVCLPTTYGEGVPRILIEAASCQRAIVTTDVVGCREIVSDTYNGFLVKPADPDSLATALEKLLADSDIVNLFGANGRIKVEAEFSQEQVFQKTKNVYNELL